VDSACVPQLMRSICRKRGCDTGRRVVYSIILRYFLASCHDRFSSTRSHRSRPALWLLNSLHRLASSLPLDSISRPRAPANPVDQIRQFFQKISQRCERASQRAHGYHSFDHQVRASNADVSWSRAAKIAITTNSMNVATWLLINFWRHACNVT